MEETHNDQRISWLDVARALGIFLVVFGHVERGLQTAGILDPEVWGKVDFMIYTFHMPLFFFLSGMNVMRSRERPGFFHKRVKAIMVPYFVFSLLQGGIQIVMSGQTNGSLEPWDLAMIPFSPISPYWFLYVLFFYVFLVSIWKPSLTMFAIAIVMTVLSPFAKAAAGGFPAFQIMYFLSFYVAGSLFKPQEINRRVGFLAVSVWVIYSVLALRLGAVPEGDYYKPYMIPAAIGGIVAIIWISQAAAEKVKILSYVGVNVIAIYVMHIMATAGTRIFLLKAGVLEPFMHMFFGTLAGIALPLMALWIMQRVHVAPLLGLPPGRFKKTTTGNLTGPGKSV